MCGGSAFSLGFWGRAAGYARGRRKSIPDEGVAFLGGLFKLQEFGVHGGFPEALGEERTCSLARRMVPRQCTVENDRKVAVDDAGFGSCC